MELSSVLTAGKCVASHYYWASVLKISNNQGGCSRGEQKNENEKAGQMCVCVGLTGEYKQYENKTKMHIVVHHLCTLCYNTVHL